MKQIYYSIVIPLYNKRDYIEKTINSILKQTYQNFEIIVVNDGSTDNGEIIVSKIPSYKIRLINQLNKGVSSARNKGVIEATNDYIAFLDADDEWDENFLSELNILIEKFPNAGIYATNNYFIYPNGRKICHTYNSLFKGQRGLIENYFECFARNKVSPFSNSNICIPKNIFQEFDGYKVGVRLTEDSDLWCRIALKYDIAYSKIPLSTYYLNQKNNTGIIFQKQTYEVVLTLEEALLSNDLTPQFRKSIKKLIAFQRLSYSKRALITNNRQYALINLKYIDILKYYPIDYLICILSFFLPNNIFNKIRKMI